MLNDKDKAFCSRSRYLHEVADYLNISKPTLMIWLQDIEGFDFRRYSDSRRRLFTPKELKTIFENVL